MLLFNKIFHNAISTKTNENELGITKIINTESFSGKINGLPTTHDNFLKEGFNDSLEYLDLWNLYLTLQKYFNAVFRWEGLTLKENRILERILFRRGSAVIYVMPDGELFISEYTLKDNVQNDLYDYPKEVIINCVGNPMDGRKINNNFAIIYNNTTLQPTLLPVWKRIIEYLIAVDKNDKVSITSDVKVPYSDNSDSLKADELNAKWYTDEVFIKVNSEWLRTNAINPVVLQNAGKDKQEIELFHMDIILMFLGLKAQNIQAKSERQTELEVSNNDKFEGKIIQDMFNMRLEGEEQIKEKLNRSDIRPIEPESLTEAKFDAENIGSGGEIHHFKDPSMNKETNND